jgi:hypothetical protein
MIALGALTVHPRDLISNPKKRPLAKNQTRLVTERNANL